MSRIFVDVTQLVHWSGKLTGIPRVMHELAVRFAKQNPEAIFVSWVKEQEVFYEIDFAQSMQTRTVVYVKQQSQPETQPVQAATTTSTLHKTAKRIVKAGLRRAGRFTPQLAEKFETRLRDTHLKQFKIADLQSGDILFIPWGEWWDPRFTDKLVGLHQEGVKLVQVIHDVGTVVWPQFFEQVKVSPASYNKQIVPIADLVLTVSHNTKRELAEWLKQHKLHVPKIEVFRLGDDIRVAKPIKPLDPLFKQADLKGDDFIMCVGTIEAKKNHLMFYYVYKLAKARGIKLPKLVIVGRRGWMTDATFALMTNDPEVKDDFVFMLNTSDEELVWLFKHCMFTVLPSFHEGWGIPIAESLNMGAPCLCSNTSSMVEIAEGIVGHFSPTSTDECLAAIQAWLDPKELAKARERTKKYKPTSWDETYKQVSNYIQQEVEK